VSARASVIVAAANSAPTHIVRKWVMTKNPALMPPI